MHVLPGQHAHLPSSKVEWLAHAGKPDGAVREYTHMTINSTPQQLYRLWRDVSLAPRWMERIISAEENANGETVWTLEVAPSKDSEHRRRYSWTSRIVSDVPGEKIAWRSTGGEIEEAGEVVFRQLENGRGTEVFLISEFRVPGGKAAALAAGMVARSPGQTVIEDLRHFKALAEAGEIPTVEGQPHGPRGVSGGIKEILYGENNPTPPGTQDLA